MTIPMKVTKSTELQTRFHSVIPGGSHTYAKGDDQYPEMMPVYLVRGKGCHVWDVDGDECRNSGGGAAADGKVSLQRSGQPAAAILGTSGRHRGRDAGGGTGPGAGGGFSGRGQGVVRAGGRGAGFRRNDHRVSLGQR